MADRKVSDLPSLDVVEGNELLYTISNLDDYSVTVDTLLQYINGNVQATSIDGGVIVQQNQI